MARSPSPTNPSFRKSSPEPRPGYFQLEAAGLRWLAEGPVRCAEVISVSDSHVELQRITPASPNPAAAQQFGHDLAMTHDLGAPAFGSAPPVPPPDSTWPPSAPEPAPTAGWRRGWFGPLSQPLEVSLEPTDSWGTFYGGQRLAPMLDLLRESGTPSSSLVELEKVSQALTAGHFDDDDSPARIHGDLWSGNLMWDAEGAVLIDPAAHGDHREQDVAFLALFGAPYLEDIVTGYQRVHPLRAGWRDRIELHQLFVLAAHAVLFDPPGGGDYLHRSRRAARSALNLVRG